MKATKEKLISGLLLLVGVLLRFPAPASAQSVAATTATPTLAERLDRLTSLVVVEHFSSHRTVLSSLQRTVRERHILVTC